MYTYRVVYGELMIASRDFDRYEDAHDYAFGNSIRAETAKIITLKDGVEQ